ncbi:MAG: nucleotide exchange factor GrpE [Actinomycetota bacterium]|nr:nucleotide exchange factor GrpE [Actinomycetota bacterium]
MSEETTEGIKVTDKRRIDPETGEVRAGVSAPAAASDEPTEVSDLAAELTAELTADLQRITAEYANYRKRVDRDRDLIKDLAIATVLEQLLPLLDDIDRAKEHQELTGGFAAVADNLTKVVERFNLVPTGAVGDEFNPTEHEALQVIESTDFTVPSVATVLRKGYRRGEKLIRPAQVVVAEPIAANLVEEVN